MIKFLETERLIIAAPTDDYIALVNQLDSDPDVMRYIGDGNPRFQPESCAWYKKSIEHYAKYGYSFGLVFEKSTGEFVGRAGINYNAYDDTQSDIEIGYRLHKKYWNKGYATELARALVKLGFENLGLEKICGFAHPDNFGSRHVLEKIGMRYVGVDKYAESNVVRYEIFKQNHESLTISLHTPNEEIAAFVVASMSHEKVQSVSRLTTGDQHFVFAVKTAESDLVLRLTNHSQRHKFLSAIYWQEKFLPLGIPLAKFIDKDMDGRFSSFPALLMRRLPGDDLCNVYANLTNVEKRNLASEMIDIQRLCEALPNGSTFGILDTYEGTLGENSWYEFLRNRLLLYRDIIKKNKVFDENKINDVISMADSLKDTFDTIVPRPFLWDASERNVIVNHGKISGIVDVDEICFGDPLLVLGLTYSALELEEYDTLYCDYWAEQLHLDNESKIRLAFYRLFYSVVFIRKHSMITANQQKVMFNIQRLTNIFEQCLLRLKTLKFK